MLTSQWPKCFELMCDAVLYVSRSLRLYRSKLEVSSERKLSWKIQLWRSKDMWKSYLVFVFRFFRMSPNHQNRNPRISRSNQPDSL